MKSGVNVYFGRKSPVVLTAVAALLMITLSAAGTGGAAHPAAATVQVQQAIQFTTGPCTESRCTFPLKVNPGLLAGTFACPAIQNARAHITIINRFATGGQNDLMILTASGLPSNTGFDMFLVEHTPLDSGTFGGFGFGWYQSDIQSTSNGTASVNVRGIFDKETFIENPANPFVPIHTFNVGFWFGSPTQQAQVCNSPTPAITPFNGEQNAGLLAMITQGEPLQFVQ